MVIICPARHARPCWRFVLVVAGWGMQGGIVLFGGPAAHTFCDVFLAMLCEVLVCYLGCVSGHSNLVGVREA